MHFLLDRLLRALAWVLFKLFHDIEIEGAEYVPASGAVIIAGNHPSYLDPAYILVGLHRPVRFLAWEKPFAVPVLGALMRRYGAIPVNTDKPGRASFESAVRVLRAGEAFGIFPEGGRSDFGVMKPLKSGVARLAMMTGAPIVPVTIRGAFRVWPKHQLLPRPGYVKVIFHPPIRLDRAELAVRHGGAGASDHQAELRRDRDYEKRLVEQVMDAINSSLLPGLRKEMREESLYYRARVSWTWTSDFIPYLFLGALLAACRLTGAMLPPRIVIWMALYTMYLALDILVHIPGGWAKGLRQRMPWLLLGLMAAHETAFAPPALACVVVLYLALAWYASFRFSNFKRLRAPALLLLYALYFVHVYRSLL